MPAVHILPWVSMGEILSFLPAGAARRQLAAKNFIKELFIVVHILPWVSMDEILKKIILLL